MSKRQIAKRVMHLGLRIGKYAKNEIEKEAKYIAKAKLADKKMVKAMAKKMLAEAGKMKAKLESYAKAEIKIAAKMAKKKKR